jgi:hypothetical protein
VPIFTQKVVSKKYKDEGYVDDEGLFHNYPECTIPELEIITQYE